MTAVKRAGAAAGKVKVWKDLNWKVLSRNVQRLQARIVKATQEGRWGKVKSLQRLITCSFSAKAIAVKRVNQNSGSKTSGVDGILWKSSTQKIKAIHDLKVQEYRPEPLRRVYIPKAQGKKRPLGIPTMKDRAMQALHLLAVDPVAETTSDPNSYGFRKGRSTADAIQQCFKVLSRRYDAQWVLEADIKSCFDGISHEWLIANIPMNKDILRKWLKAGFIENQIKYETHSGTPQGGIISAVLANMTLNGLETGLKEACTKRHKGVNNKLNVVRYADDFIVTGSSKELLEQQVLPYIQTFLKERGLELSLQKTKIVHIQEGFDFLGQNIRKYKHKLLIKPAKKNVKALLKKIRQIIKKGKQWKSKDMILKLNPIIRGWANYHRHVVSKATYSLVDYKIFESLWKWASRRHPRQSKVWLKNKYFQPLKNRKWVFGLKEAKGEQIHLQRAAETPIKRHNKVKGQANVYDPKWREYILARQSRSKIQQDHGIEVCAAWQ